MIKWSIKLFTWYSLSPPVLDFSNLWHLQSRLRNTRCTFQRWSLAPIHKPSWTLNAPDFRELECVFSTLNCTCWYSKLNHICANMKRWWFQNTEVFGHLLTSDNYDDDDNKAFRSRFQHDDLARDFHRDLSRSQVGEMAMERNSPTFFPPNLCLV